MPRKKKKCRILGKLTETHRTIWVLNRNKKKVEYLENLLRFNLKRIEIKELTDTKAIRLQEFLKD